MSVRSNARTGARPGRRIHLLHGCFCGCFLAVLLMALGSAGPCAGMPAGRAGPDGAVAASSAGGEAAEAVTPSVTVSSEEKSQISLGFTPEEGWRGEIYLRPEVTVGTAGPAGVAGSPPAAPRLILRLGVDGATLDFHEPATAWSFRPEEITLFAEGPLREGGSTVKGVLGDLRLPLPGYLGGDSRRNGVRGVALAEVGILPQAVASLFFGWTSESVSPLLRSEESPGSDYLTGGGWLQWTPAPDSRVELAAAWREGSVPAAYFAGSDPSQQDEGWFYREDVGAVALSRTWQGLQLSARAGWQARRLELDRRDERVRQWTGFAALELVRETRDQQRRHHSQALRIYAVPAEFFPWAARRSTAANAIYRWRGEVGVEWEGVTWLGARPSYHKIAWRLGAGRRVRELPGYDELIAGLTSVSSADAVSPSHSTVNVPSLPLETAFGRGRVELTGALPAFSVDLCRWLEHCQYRWRAEVESGRGGWTDLRVWRTLAVPAGPVEEWTPAYSVRWEAPQWAMPGSGARDNDDDRMGVGDGDGPPSVDDSGAGAGLTHTLSLALKLSLGAFQGIKASWSRSVTVRGQFTDTWSIAYDSPNGWEWRCKWTVPDDPVKSTDSYFEVRQRFEL